MTHRLKDRKPFLGGIVFAMAVALTAPSTLAADGPRPDTLTASSNADDSGISAVLAALPEEAGLDALGSISVGHPHDGYLLNGVEMPKSKRWLLADPQNAWGTTETITAIVRCIDKVFQQFPDSSPAIIGSVSRQGGGPFSPHKSHQSGRDADVYLWIKDRGRQWYVPGNAENLDRARTWAFMRSVITGTDVEYILLDRAVQPLVEEYALSVESDKAWVQELFHGDGKYFRPMIKHVPGHTGHMHVRFYNPIAQQRGRLAYDQIVAQGHLPLKRRGISHTVEANDTLSGIALRYNTNVERILELNSLKSDVIRVGQVLNVEKAVELRAARDEVVIPPRHLPDNSKLRAPTPKAATRTQRDQLLAQSPK